MKKILIAICILSALSACSDKAEIPYYLQELSDIEIKNIDIEKAKTGDSNAMYRLGKCVAEGTSSFMPEMFKYNMLVKAAGLNHQDAILDLAQCYKKGIKNVYGVTLVDSDNGIYHELVRRWYEITNENAKAGNARSLLILGDLYYQGKGHNLVFYTGTIIYDEYYDILKIKKDPIKSASYFALGMSAVKKEANAGSIEAKYLLSAILSNGFALEPKNELESESILRAMADSGVAVAKYDLGKKYYDENRELKLAQGWADVMV